MTRLADFDDQLVFERQANCCMMSATATATAIVIVTAAASAARTLSWQIVHACSPVPLTALLPALLLAHVAIEVSTLFFFCLMLHQFFSC